MGGDIVKCLTIDNEFISIHTTRVGGDDYFFIFQTHRERFQSTPPVWVVTGLKTMLHNWDNISIHTTRVGGDK